MQGRFEHHIGGGDRRPWRKNLYDNAEYPDNYTDDTFLEELRTNLSVREPSLGECVCGSGAVLSEICTVTLFVLVYTYLHNDWVDARLVFMVTSALTASAFVYCRLRLARSPPRSPVTEELKTLLIFLAFGYIFSPVLHTLTDTISTDTIYTMTFFMMCTHLVFFDYGLPAAALASNSLSLNAAMFGSICLASRLASPYHAFVLMTVSIECFVLLPVMRERLGAEDEAAGSSPRQLYRFVAPVITLCVLGHTCVPAAVFFCALALFLTLVCPSVFLAWHKHKYNIYGPWDEAIVQDLQQL